MENQNKDLVQITREYYDSKEADEFYFHIWGGEDIHIGVYDPPELSIKEASQKTVWAMIKHLPPIQVEHRVLDLGSGYGGGARLLAKQFGCQVQCLNLSETENERNRKKCKEEHLDQLVSVTTGNFEQIPFEDSSFNLVWMQDALLHSNQKLKVFQEITRVLKPGGYFIMTDPMQSDDCPEGVLQPVLERIHLEEMGSVKRYKGFGKELGLEYVGFTALEKHLIRHYSKVLDTLKAEYDQIRTSENHAYLQKMMKGLQHWIEAGNKGYLNWGILQFRKKPIHIPL